MKILTVLAFALCLIVFPQAGQAYEVRTLYDETYIFDNVNCEETQSCSLKRVRFYVRDYHLIADIGDSLGTSLFAWYETDSLESLEEYVFVQFIRGCVYESYNDDGIIRTHMFNRNKWFGRRGVKYRFPEWVIDSTDHDPAANSIQGYSRHHAYKWNTPPFETFWKTERWYGEEMPRAPILYINDYPLQAIYFPPSTKYGVYFGEHAINLSLEFRTGIYRAEDVPLRAEPDDLDFAEPLFSVSWNTSFIYNYETGVFDQPEGIVSVCR